jgi:hypothetical protein
MELSHNKFTEQNLQPIGDFYAHNPSPINSINMLYKINPEHTELSQVVIIIRSKHYIITWQKYFGNKIFAIKDIYASDDTYLIALVSQMHEEKTQMKKSTYHIKKFQTSITLKELEIVRVLTNLKNTI